jgi:hypothetical protein
MKMAIIILAPMMANEAWAMPRYKESRLPAYQPSRKRPRRAAW